MTFLLPPQLQTQGNRVRKVGFEIEFAGVGLKKIAGMIVDIFGGRHIHDDRFINKVADTKYGDFTVEIDATALKDRTYETYLKNYGIVLDDVSIKDNILELVENIFGAFVPKLLTVQAVVTKESKISDKLRIALQDHMDFIEKLEIDLDEFIAKFNIEDYLKKILSPCILEFIADLTTAKGSFDIVEKLKSAMHEHRQFLLNLEIDLEEILSQYQVDAFLEQLFTSAIPDVLLSPPRSIEEFRAVEKLRQAIDDQAQNLRQHGIDIDKISVKSTFENFLASFASTLVPFEISTPGIPITDLEAIETLRQALQTQKAQGSKSSIFYAFGLHINPELADINAKSILNTLRAFFLLYDWIFIESKIDLSRRIAPFIHEFPLDYIRLVLDPGYSPDLELLIDDYIRYNPTRNRPLDLLPIFTYVNPSKVRQILPQEKINPRPTFHFRLPNCLVDMPEWTIAQEWYYWVQVERLTDNPEHIRNLSHDFLKAVNIPWGLFRPIWHQKIKKWHQSLQHSAPSSV